MPTTELQAREIDTAITDFKIKDAQAVQAQHDADLAVAETWFNSLGINIQGAITRTQALLNYRQIESLLQAETDSFRFTVLRENLDEANTKYRTVKKVNPNS